MSFQNGSVTFQRCQVTGNRQPSTSVDMVSKLVERQFKHSEFPEPCEFGWSAGRHIYDVDFSLDSNVYADALFFGLRIDTNVVPGAVRKAWQQMEAAEVARGNPSGFISKIQLREVKESVSRKVEAEVRSGKFRKSKLVPILWDVTRGYLYTSASNSSFEKLSEIFYDTFDLELTPMTSGFAARVFADKKGSYPELEAAQPTNFCANPAIVEYPSYPWISKQPDTRNFLGNEFLLWLWFKQEHGSIQTVRPGPFSEVTVFMSKMLTLDCSFGQSGKDSIHDDGFTQSPEAKEALRIGKIPRKAGLLLNLAHSDYSTMFNPEMFSFGGTKLPEIEEAATARVMFEERITLLADLCTGMDALFETFLTERLDNLRWPSTVEQISAWINPNDVPSATAELQEVGAA